MYVGYVGCVGLILNTIFPVQNVLFFIFQRFRVLVPFNLYDKKPVYIY